MFDKDIAFRIKKLLEKESHNSFKINEIQYELKIRKHKHRDLIDTLIRLVKEGEIQLKNRRYQAQKKEKKELVYGIFDASSIAKNRSYAFVNTSDNDIFISAEDTLNAYHGDKVEVELKYGKNKKKYGVIVKIIERCRETFAGNIEAYRGKYYLIPDNTRIHTNFMISDLGGAMPGQKAVIRITNWGSRELYRLPAGKIVEVLGRAGEPAVEILSVIKHFDLPMEFSERVITELKYISDDISEEEIRKRKDLRDLVAFTIDPISAKDYDDAISLKRLPGKYIIYVHIADVAHYVPVTSDLFREAVARGNSYYFPRQVLPMLPEKISNKICSLRPHENKLTLTVEIHIDKNFNIISQDVYESVIRSWARLNYEEVDLFFQGADANFPGEVRESLQEMRIISRLMFEQRLKRGYISLNLPETEFIFDEEGFISDLKRSEETEAHRLIENFMLLANEYIAVRLSDQPTLYRIHEFPEEEKMNSLQEVISHYGLRWDDSGDLHQTLQQLLMDMPGKDYHRVFDHMVLRSMKKAKYSVRNYGHFGLAMDTYTHFTSPIRRLCDLVIHHQIKDRIRSRSQQFTRLQLEDYAVIASDRENVADESEREVEIKNKLLYMSKRVGEEFTGIVVAIRPGMILVELDAIPVSGIIELAGLKEDYYEYFENHRQLVGKKYGRTFRLLDRLSIMVSKVTNDVYLQLID